MQTETTISGLTSLTAYAIKVAAVNSVSDGPYIKIQAETDGRLINNDGVCRESNPMVSVCTKI